MGKSGVTWMTGRQRNIWWIESFFGSEWPPKALPRDPNGFHWASSRERHRDKMSLPAQARRPDSPPLSRSTTSDGRLIETWVHHRSFQLLTNRLRDLLSSRTSLLFSVLRPVSLFFSRRLIHRFAGCRSATASCLSIFGLNIISSFLIRRIEPSSSF